MWRNIKNKIIGHAYILYTPVNKLLLKINGRGVRSKLKS